MANNVNAQVHGRSIVRDLSGNTVQSILDQMDVQSNVTATVNGEPAELSQTISDYDFVTFSKAVDGGCK
jgi:hypothetical protein